MSRADRDFAAAVAESAVKAGATAAEVLLRQATDFSAAVRFGEIDTVTESSSKGLGLRVIVDGRQASVSTSDFGDGPIAKIVCEAVELARASSVDESADLPDEFATDLPDLGLYDPAVEALSVDEKIALAIEAERAAKETDPRIVNFDRGGVSTSVSRTVLANSRGFAGTYTATSISLAVVPVAAADGQMQRDSWYDARRAVAELESPEAIGRMAAERTVRRLGARKIPSCEVPVIFEPRVSRDFVGIIFDAVSGDSVVRKGSFLTERLGERVASEHITLVDDGRLAGALGSRPFDGEGVATRRTVVIADGIFESYLLNTYTGRKIGAPSTGNAARGLVGQIRVGAGNLYLEPGSTSLEELIRSMRRGLLITELIGQGVNVVNGDYSRGASGHWIETGEIAYPVHEVTIAGNLKEMLRGVRAVGSDLDFRGRIGAPSVLIDRMVVSGQ